MTVRHMRYAVVSNGPKQKIEGMEIIVVERVEQAVDYIRGV